MVDSQVWVISLPLPLWVRFLLCYSDNLFWWKTSSLRSNLPGGESWPANRHVLNLEEGPWSQWDQVRFSPSEMAMVSAISSTTAFPEILSHSDFWTTNCEIIGVYSIDNAVGPIESAVHTLPSSFIKEPLRTFHIIKFLAFYQLQNSPLF